MDPFENKNPKGVIKGAISIGIYVDPMGPTYDQEKDFLLFEDIIEYHMGSEESIEYYTTRLESPSQASYGNFDLVVIDYGGMTLPGMSGMEDLLGREVQSILVDKPSTIVWLASIITGDSYSRLVEEEYGEKHSNLIISDLEYDASWVYLQTLWGA